MRAFLLNINIVINRLDFMIKKTLLILLLITNIAFAKNDKKTLIFKDITIAEFIDIYFGVIEKKPYIISDVTILDNKKITLNVDKIDYKNILPIFDQILSANKLTRQIVNDVTIIRQVTSEKPDAFVYKPKYRKVSYLTNMLKNTFSGSFSNIRGKDSDETNYNPDKASGTNAYSNLNVVSDVILFTGTSYEIEKLKIIISEIDIPKKELIINAKIYELLKKDIKEDSISIIGTILKGAGLSLSSNLGVVAESFLKISNANLGLIYKSIEDNGNFKTISNPFIRVSDGEQARLLSGNETPTISSINKNENGEYSNTVDYKNSGIIFTVTPNISNIINLKLYAEISDFQVTKTGVNITPTLNKRAIDTTIQINDGEAIIIGGMTNKKDTNNKSTLFGFIPISNEIATTQNEIVIILTANKIDVN